MNSEFDLGIGVGEVVQISPECQNRMFGGCLMVVTEVRPWGVQGYVQALGQDGKIGGQAYVRVKWAEIETTTGAAVWMVGEGE